MNISFLIKILHSLKPVCIGLALFAGVLLITCYGCKKEEKVAEEPEEFKEIITVTPESQPKKVEKETAPVEVTQGIPGQPAKVVNVPQPTQPPTVKQILAQDLYEEGIKQFKQGQLEEAIESFNKATEIDTTMTDAYEKMALIYSRLGRVNEAINAFKKVVELNPNDAEEYLNLGTLYAKKRMADDAIRAF